MEVGLDIKKAQKYMEDFWSERKWNQYRTPKNLCMALAVEVGELMELFQWMDNISAKEITDPKTKADIKSEMADIFSYLVQLASTLDIDLEEAFWEKTKEVEKKYPISKN